MMTVPSQLAGCIAAVLGDTNQLLSLAQANCRPNTEVSRVSIRDGK
jgi:hypothetical protein